ncbi:hypothetical protein BDQ12DRAFT_667530 [Crucibulum laeve]|uniref:Uncharacterized protein n=1 Tax=Crucibulum laeve TaxID=68775 RepID=A0A5C3LU53_9AGAR|nr:hypothetical protein BDQ12DRAFT_667530 [Crucibulum laeve]
MQAHSNLAKRWYRLWHLPEAEALYFDEHPIYLPLTFKNIDCARSAWLRSIFNRCFNWFFCQPGIGSFQCRKPALRQTGYSIPPSSSRILLSASGGKVPVKHFPSLPGVVSTYILIFLQASGSLGNQDKFSNLQRNRNRRRDSGIWLDGSCMFLPVAAFWWTHIYAYVHRGSGGIKTETPRPRETDEQAINFIRLDEREGIAKQVSVA